MLFMDASHLRYGMGFVWTWISQLVLKCHEKGHKGLLKVLRVHSLVSWGYGVPKRPLGTCIALVSEQVRVVARGWGHVYRLARLLWGAPVSARGPIARRCRTCKWGNKVLPAHFPSVTLSVEGRCCPNKPVRSE